MKKIPIVLITDEKQVKQCAVVIFSALRNRQKENEYSFYIFSKKELAEADKTKIGQMVARFKNANLSFVQIQEDWVNVKKTHIYVTIESAYKMLIPKYLSQYDKVLYLDTDVLVRDDLADLYDCEMEDNYLAGVINMWSLQEREDVIKAQSGLNDLSFYINAGVMLMNVKAIRADKIDEKCISLLGTCEGSVDQHIFNKVCYGKIAFLPFKYNVCYSDVSLYQSEQIRIFAGISQMREAFENPSIFHWTGAKKPWKYRDTFLAHEWFRYYIQTPFKNELFEREKMLVTEKEYKQKFLFGLIKIRKKGHKKIFRICGIKFVVKRRKK